MAKVKMKGPGEPASAETPSERIVASAVKTAWKLDSRGRRIEVRRLNTLERMRLVKLVGADAAKNEAYMGMAGIAAGVVMVEEDRFYPPTTLAQLEAMVNLLGDEGMEAAAMAMAEVMGFDLSGAEDPGAARNLAVADAKN